MQIQTAKSLEKIAGGARGGRLHEWRTGGGRFGRYYIIIIAIYFIYIIEFKYDGGR